MTGPYYTLEAPWVESKDRGRTTTILRGGGGDPHEAEEVADTACLMGCKWCDYGVDLYYHAGVARLLVRVLNAGVEALAKEDKEESE